VWSSESATAPAVPGALLSFLPQDVVRASLTDAVDGRVLLFALAVSIITGVLCGTAPALHAGRQSLIAALRERAAGGGAVGLRRALVVGQIALTLLLLICAGLFVQTVSRLHAKGPGFESERLLMFQVNAAQSGYDNAAGARAVLQVLEAVRSTPGVDAAAIGGQMFLAGGSWNTSMTIDFKGRRATDRLVHCSPVTPGFFATLGVRFVAGRDFEERGPIVFDDKTRRYRSAIVNASFARRYFGDASPIGYRIGFGTRPDTRVDVEIVGVVADFSYRGIREETEQAFFPFLDIPWAGGTFYVRTPGPPANAIAAVRGAVAKVDPALPILSLRTIGEQIDGSLTTERMMATLLSGFGAAALLLSVIGLYGVMSFVVTQRTREIGVRLALGATRGAAVWLVVRGALIMIGSGTAIALAAGSALGRVVAAQLFDVAPVHVPTITLATGLLVVVALAAAWLPAWRAASVSPTEALHAE
jgi:predicted permease